MKLEDKMVDVDVYFGNWPFRNTGIKSIGKLKEFLRKKGIKKAVLNPISAIFLKDTRPFYCNFFSQIKPYKKFFLPLLIINPLLPWEEVINSFRRRIFAVALYPRFHRYSLDSSPLLNFLKEIENKSLPVFISLRIIDDRQIPPMLSIDPPLCVNTLLKLCKRFPSIKFVFTGINGTELIELQKVSPGNIFVDTSFIEGEEIWEGIRKKWLSHILFGSHFPFFYLEASLEKIRNSSLNVSCQRKIFHENFKLLKQREVKDGF